jgi:hypothetical protein
VTLVVYSYFVQGRMHQRNIVRNAKDRQERGGGVFKSWTVIENGRCLEMKSIY